MYGNILTQRLNYFRINAFKNYSSLKDKEPLEDVIKMDINTLNIDSFFFSSINGVREGIPCRMLDLRPKDPKKNSSYFYSDNNEYTTVRLQPYFDLNKNTYGTTNERHLKRHYNTPFSEVSTHIFERTITLTDDIFSIRVNKYAKIRGVNSKYYKKNSMICGIKLNLKTGNLITYRTTGGKKNKSKEIRQNHFKHLYQTLDNLFTITTSFSDLHNSDEMERLFKQEIDNRVFEETLYHSLCSLLKLPDYGDTYPLTEGPVKFTFESIIKLFVQIKNIKVPNNYFHYITNWYPTKKYLVKNENKLIAAILDRIGIKSKSLVKLLHKIPNVSLYNLSVMIKFFGYEHIHKFLPNINQRFITCETRRDVNGFNFLENQKTYHLTLNEKSRLLKLLNSLFDEESPFDKESIQRIIDSQLNQVNDHLSMLEKIKECLPDVELRSENFKAFHHEHIEYSKLHRKIQKGYSIEYVFEKSLVDHIEDVIMSPKTLWLEDEAISQPIDGEPTLFYPVILKTDAEYSEEGEHMHHCVATYADREQSLIISIRKGSPEGNDRVTCEFDTRTKRMVQAKSFCNARPPEEFKHALEKVEHRIDIYKRSIKSIGKERIPLIINGVKIEVPEKKSTGEELMDQIQRFVDRPVLPF